MSRAQSAEHPSAPEATSGAFEVSEPPRGSDLKRKSPPSHAARFTFGACASFLSASPLCALSDPSHSDLSSRNFVQVSTERMAPSRSNFIVIKSFSSGASVGLGSGPSQSAQPAERVVLSKAALEEFVASRNMAVNPVLLHLSQRTSRGETSVVYGLRGVEVWRYELTGGSRRVSRIGIAVPADEQLRADHERAVVGSKVVLAWRPSIDLPTGEAKPEAGAPVFTFLRTSDAVYQVNRASGEAFTISQVGVLTETP
jgi:hypothetical protein